jgi:hypothetical protein
VEEIKHEKVCKTHFREKGALNGSSKPFLGGCGLWKTFPAVSRPW